MWYELFSKTLGLYIGIRFKGKLNAKTNLFLFDSIGIVD